MSPLPAEVIERDHALTTTGTQLMALRHYWTLDESNPERVTTAEYARQVGIASQTVDNYARGYQLLLDEKASNASEALERSHMSLETQAATEAVMEIFNVSFNHASRHYRDDIRFIREEARELAEELDTDFWTQLPTAIKSLRQRVAQRVAGGGGGSRGSEAFIRVDSRLVFAREKIASCVEVARSAGFGKEEQEDLVSRVGEVLDKLEELEALLKEADSPVRGIALVS